MPSARWPSSRSRGWPAGSSSSRHPYRATSTSRPRKRPARAAGVVDDHDQPVVALDETGELAQHRKHRAVVEQVGVVDEHREVGTALSQPDEQVGLRGGRRGPRRRATASDPVTPGRAVRTATGRPAAHSDSATNAQRVGAPGAWRAGDEQAPAVARGLPAPGYALRAQPQQHRGPHRVRPGRHRLAEPGRARGDGRRAGARPSARPRLPRAGRPAAAATAALSAGVTPANCTSRLSCTAPPGPAGGSRGASEARRPASAASSGSIVPSRKVLARHPGPSRVQECPASRDGAHQPDRRDRRAAGGRAAPLRSSSAWVGWASASCSQPSTSSRIVGRSHLARRHAAAGRGTEPPVDLVAQVPSAGLRRPGGRRTRPWCRRGGARRGRRANRGCRCRAGAGSSAHGSPRQPARAPAGRWCDPCPSRPRPATTPRRARQPRGLTRCRSGSSTSPTTTARGVPWGRLRGLRSHQRGQRRPATVREAALPPTRR